MFFLRSRSRTLNGNAGICHAFEKTRENIPLVSLTALGRWNNLASPDREVTDIGTVDGARPLGGKPESAMRSTARSRTTVWECQLKARFSEGPRTLVRVPRECESRCACLNFWAIVVLCVRGLYRSRIEVVSGATFARSNLRWNLRAKFDVRSWTLRRCSQDLFRVDYSIRAQYLHSTGVHNSTP